MPDEGRRSWGTPAGVLSAVTAARASVFTAGNLGVGITMGWSVAVRAAGLFALAVGAFQIVNSLWWRGRTYWARRGLRAPLLLELAFAGFLPLGIGWIDLEIGATWWLALLCSAGLGVLGANYETLQEEIAERARVRGLASGTTRLAHVKPFKWFGNVKTFKQLAETNRGFGLEWLGRVFLEDEVQRNAAELRRSPSLMRRVVAFGLLLGFAMPLVAAAGALVTRQLHRPAAGAVDTGHRHAVTAARPLAAAIAAQNDRKTHLQPQPAWDGVCIPSVGSSAPKWARIAVYLSISGPGAFGRRVDGCPGTFSSTSGSDGRFVYAFGSDPVTGSVLSVVVASDAYGATVYLGPAIPPIEMLIHEFGIVGGPPRIPAGAGDFYLVQTPDGTAVLVRSVVSAAGQTEPYYTLPPPVAALWLESMRRFGSWLWPVARPAGDGTTLFQLVVSPLAGNSKFAISYDPTSRIASEGAQHLSAGILISESEIMALASTAAP